MLKTNTTKLDIIFLTVVNVKYGHAHVILLGGGTSTMASPENQSFHGIINMNNLTPHATSV